MPRLSQQILNDSNGQAAETSSPMVTRKRAHDEMASASLSEPNMTKKQKAVERGKKLRQALLEKQAKGEVRKAKKAKSKSKKAGLIFPVQKCLNKLKELNPNMIVYAHSSVYLASVVEYLVAELLEVSSEAALKNDHKRINPRHIFLAVENDTEFKEFLKNTTIGGGGAKPYIHPQLVKKKADLVKQTKKKSTKPTDPVSHSPKQSASIEMDQD